jgi:hypothetical protein
LWGATGDYAGNAQYVESTNTKGKMVPFCVLEPMPGKGADYLKSSKTRDLPALANKVHERQSGREKGNEQAILG